MANPHLSHTYPVAGTRSKLSEGSRSWSTFIGFIATLTLFVAVSVVPDPRPLSAPDWAVQAIQSLFGLSESLSRVVSTIVLRGMAFGLFGVLLALLFMRFPLRWAAPSVLLLSPVFAVGSQWINHGYFPAPVQWQLSIASATLGALVGLALRGSVLCIIGLGVFVAAVLAWGLSTGISNDLDSAARATGLHLLESMDDIPSGDDGFIAYMQTAFAFAEDNSHGTDPIFPNQAAILALGVILGEEKIAEVARRTIDLSHVTEFNTIRGRTTLRGRHDLSRHFSVCAALIVLTDETRTMNVAIGKELQDSLAGGSGFSFVDMLANRAGMRFALEATKNADSARRIQSFLTRTPAVSDVMPDYEGLPEGIYRDDFERDFGGLGGERTQSINQDIERRLSTLPIHQSQASQ